MRTLDLIKGLDNPNLTKNQRAALEWDIIDTALLEKVPVEIYYNDQVGEFRYAVQIVGTDFWIDSFTSKDDAIEYCKEEGLTVSQ